MMPDYHVGTLDEASRTALADGDDSIEADPNRAIFLQSKSWSKAILGRKTTISSDTKIFTFKLNHETQQVGLPTGQHLMMRLRDPVTREAIIRAYTPFSDGAQRGTLDVLIKIYFDGPERKGGKMTQALDAIPLGHFVDFKGPIGHFEYHGNGSCTIAGQKRKVRRFIMICGGSGITPIWQVLRAVLSNKADPTKSLVLDGNRSEEDILCKSELDTFAAENQEKCRLIYALSKPPPVWTGIKGRLDRPLYEREAGRPSKHPDGDELVLVCGPSPMEKSAREIFLEMGWAQDDLIFF